MRRDKTAVVLTTILILSAAGQGFAQTARDHLQCFKIKDSQAKAKYSADLSTAGAPLPALEAGCLIKVPAKHWCVDVSKQNVAPAPPGAIAGEPAQEYLCYKAKCPKTQPTVQAHDQFGNRSFAVKRTTMVCAPVTGACPQDETACGGVCTDTSSDEANCGACGTPCLGDQSCIEGNCTLACGVAETECGTSCCTALEACEAGACVPLL
jgi:hypothetical protein